MPQIIIIVDEDGNKVAVVSGALQVALQNAIPSGTNNIGDVDVLTLPSLPAGGNVIGSVKAQGYDYGNTQYRDIRVDSNGKIVVTV